MEKETYIVALGQALQPEFLRRRAAGEDIEQATLGAMETLRRTLGHDECWRMFDAARKAGA